MPQPKHLIRVLIFLLGAVIVALGIYRAIDSGKTPQHAARSLVPAEGYGSVEPFSFKDQDGKSISLDDLKGKPWVANFIFTRCAGPCPIISRKMAGLQAELKDQQDLRYISFSVDPEYDTPARLKEYAKRFNADESTWRFLTGTKKAMYELIRKSFHLAVETGDGFVEPADENHILHSLHFVLVDADGVIQGYFNSNDPERVDELKERIRAGVSP